MGPRDRLPVYVQFDIERYLSYGWKLPLITELIGRRHGYRLAAACVRALRDGTDCPKKCAVHCWIKRVAHREPDLDWIRAEKQSLASRESFDYGYKK